MPRLLCLLTGIVFSLMLLTACAEFDKKFDEALFGSEEEIQAAHQSIAEGNAKAERKKREDMEEQLFDAVCAARKKRWLPCDSRNWTIQAQAAKAAEAVAAHCAQLPATSPSTVHEDALGILPHELGDGIYMCRKSKPASVLDAWAADIRTHNILWDKTMRTFSVAVYRKGGRASSWVLLVDN